MANGRSLQKLHPDAVVYVFRHGHAAPAKNCATGDFGRVLSEKGKAQSVQLGLTLEAAKIPFDVVLCSAAPRAKQTGGLAMSELNNHTFELWHECNGRELYGPARDQDDAIMLAIANTVEVEAKAGAILSAMSYATFKQYDKNGVFGRFMDETRQVVLSLHNIEKARRIAIFNHAVIGNAVAEALYPQHKKQLETIELAPCDCIRLTETTCQHIPLYT